MSLPLSRLFRLVNLTWYLLLTPLWLLVVICTCMRVRERTNDAYCALMKSLGLGRWCTPLNVDDGELPLSVALALVVPPLYVLGLLYQDNASFLLMQSPLLLLYFLVCSDSCHYESHLWQARSSSSSSREDLRWFHRWFGLRFMQYSLAPFYPLPQHIPHLLVHHRINMANEQDVDWLGDLRRDSLPDFLRFLSRFDWRTYLHGFNFIRQQGRRGGLTQHLYRHYCLDLAVTLASYAICFYLSPCKGVFQYALHSLLNYRLAWITFFVEHPFHHANAAGSFHHPFHATTLFDADEQASDSHAAHHHLGMRSVEQNSVWANSSQFAVAQLEHRHLALKLPTRFDEWVMLPYLACTRQYARIHDFLHFVPPTNLKDLTVAQRRAYAHFQAEMTPDEIQKRMQKRTDTAAYASAAVHPHRDAIKTAA